MNNNVIREEESLIRKYTTNILKYKDGISLAIGEPYFDINSKIIDATKKSLDDKEYKYCSAQGDLELIELISLKENVNKEKILITNGASEAIFISLLTLLNTNDDVVIINPSYPQYAPLVKMLNCNVIYLDTFDTNYIPTYSSLISLITRNTKAIILNNPSNPTGIIYDKVTLKMIHDICIKYNIHLISDDVYEDIYFINDKKFKLPEKNTIKIKSFSKTYCMTGYRLGYLVAESVLMNQLHKVHSYLTICVPKFIQKAGVHALMTPKLKVEELRKNLNILYSFLDEHQVEYIEVMGGIFIFINIEEFGLSSIHFCDIFLEKYHVACVPGSCFKQEGYIRINFAVKRSDLIDGIKRLEEFINDLRVGKEN